MNCKRKWFVVANFLSLCAWLAWISWRTSDTTEFETSLTTTPSDCHDVYWCVSTRGFFAGRVRDVEAIVARTFWKDRGEMLVKSCTTGGAIPVIVDIGAGDGRDVCPMFETFRDCENAFFFFFEPQEKNIGVIDQTVKKCSGDSMQQYRSHIHHGTVGKHEKNNVHFTVTERSHKLTHERKESWFRVGHPEAITTPQLNLLQKINAVVPPASSFWIPFMKIDGEGMEPEILLAQEELLRKKVIDVIVFELNNFTIKDKRAQYHQAWNLLRECGYKLYMYGIDPEEVFATPNYILVDITYLEYWPMTLEIMVATRMSFSKIFQRGTVAPRTHPNPSEGGDKPLTPEPLISHVITDVRYKHSYFRSLVRSSKVVMDNRTYHDHLDRSVLDLKLSQYSSRARKCPNIVKRHANKCFGEVVHVTCIWCGWLRDLKEMFIWEMAL